MGTEYGRPVAARTIRKALGVGVLAIAGFGLAAPSAGASTFSQAPVGIVIPDNAVASPYPATIEVSGVPGTISDVRVTLFPQHGFARDIDVLLVSPAGASSIVFSDVCGDGPISDLLVVDDQGPLTFPEAGGLGVGPCPGGSANVYKPRDLQPGPANDTFPPPAPPLPYSAALSNLNGGPVNGTWKLFVRDDAPGASGFMGAFILEILPSGKCSGATPTRAANVGTKGDDKLTGTEGPDVMLGLGGNDSISGLGGDDVICGGDRQDTIRGGSGNDKLLGDAGKDKLVGGAGKDRFKGGPGKDTCRGDGGRDSAVCEVVRSL